MNDAFLNWLSLSLRTKKSYRILFHSVAFFELFDSGYVTDYFFHP